MATHRAIIDLIVNGQNEVDRVIRSTDQLQAAIGRINSRPLELQPGRAQQSVERLTRSLRGIDREVEQATAHLTPLRNNFQMVSREAGNLDRALQRNSRSLEVNRRQSQIYENTIRNAANGSVAFVNATAAGARAVERNTRLTEQQTQLERRRAAVDARMTYQLRQMAGAEADLAEAQERRGQAAASLGSARGFQAQIQFANRLASSYMDIAVSRERAEGTAQGARLPQFQSTAGLRSEIQFFDNLASSVATNTEAFKTFTIASRAASQSLAEVNRNRLAILAEAFTPDDPFGRMRGTSGRQLRNQDVSRTRQEVDRLIASFDQVPRSEAGLEDYIQRLGDLRSVVTFTSNAYRQLTDQMARVQALQASIPTMRGQVSAIRPTAGPASLLPQFSVQSAEKQARFRERQVADMWKMRGGPALPAGFTERGRISSEFGALGTAFLPVSGKMPGGQAPVPGSPQAKKEEADLQKKINSALIQQEELQGRIDRANLTDFQRQELTNRLLSARDAILKGNFDTSRAISGQVDLTRYSYERYNRDLVKSNKLTKDLEKYTKETLFFADRLEKISPAMFDSSDLDAFVNTFNEIESIYKDLNKQYADFGKDFDERLKVAGPFKDRLVELQTLSNDLIINSKRGVQVDQERAEVARLIQKLESGTVEANQQNLKLVSDTTASFKKRLALRISEAKVAGTYETGRGVAGAKPVTPETLEGRVQRLLGRAIGLEGRAISLQEKGATNADQLRLEVQQKINALKQLEGNITSQNAEAVANDLRILLKSINEISNALGEARNQITQAAKLTGFDKSFENFQDSLKQSRTFFENVSPAEAIDKIVREFNQGALKPSGGADAVAESIRDSFVVGLKDGIPDAVNAAIQYSKSVIKAFRDSFRARSPSQEIIDKVVIPIVQAFEKLKEFTGRGVAAAKFFADGVEGGLKVDPTSVSGPRGQLSDVATRVGGFVARTSANPSFSRKLVSLAGENILSSPAVTEAAYRKAYERGGIVPSMYLSASARRGLRGTPGIPGAGLESALFGTALRTASRTGAFVGPLGGPQGRTVGLSTMFSPEIGRGTGLPSASVGAPAGIFQVQAKQAQIATAGLYSMVGEKTFKDFSAKATEVTAASVPTALDNLKQSLSILGADLSSKSESMLAKGRESGQKIAEFADDISSLGKTFFTGTGAGRAVSGALQSAQKIKQTLSGFRPEGREDIAPLPIATLATPRNTIASIQAEIDELQRKTASAIEDAGTEASGGLKRRIKEAVESLGDRVRGGLFGSGSGTGSGGGLPPSPPTPPGGGPDDFNDRLTAASQQGVQGLLGLAELRDPSKVATARLEILSRVLQEVYSQLDPVAPGAKQLSKELRETIGTLNNIQASKAVDADFLVRLTKNPRLAAGISEGLIGGAFPLLFGQGVGASFGGGLGGFFGGAAGGALGFGLSLIGTAVGSAVDTTVNNLKELASSLKEPTTALEAMKTAGLKVDSGLQDLVGRLETVGNAAAAQAIVFAELEKQLGPGAAKQLNALSEEQKKLDEINQKLYAALSSEMLPLLTGTISIINDFAAALQRIASIDVPDWVKNVGGAAFNVASVVNPGFGLSRAQFENARKRGQEAAERAGTPSLTPEGQRKQELLPFQSTAAALSAGLEASDIAKKYTDAIKTAAEEQKDLDNQRFELIESYEKSIADIRRGVEQRITQERLAVIAKENELFAAQGEVRLQQLRNANAELRATVFGNEIGQQLVDAVSEFTEKQLSTENEVANRRRSLELELESKRIEIEQYRIDVAKQVSDLNLSTQKQVEKINDGILKKNQAYDRSRFEIEKRININNLEIKRLEAKQQENLFRGAANNANPAIAKQNRELADLYANQATFIEAQKNAVKSFAPPPQLSFGSVSASASVSTAGLDTVAARGKQLATAIASVQNELSSLVSSGDFIGFNARLKEIADQGVTGLINQFEQLRGELSNDPLGAQFAKIGEAFEAVSKAPEIAPYRELVLEYQKLAEANVKLGASLEFFLGKAGEQSSQLDSLRVEINSAISGTTELEKAMMDLTQRGISPASEEFRILTENAAKLDMLQQKLQIINNFKTASSELTLSLRGLIEGFYELGSASEAVKRVGEELGRKSLGFVLDIAFKPVEQAMQKTMFDLAGKLGFDIKPEQLQQLEEIKATRLVVADILKEITKFSGYLSGVTAPTNTSAAGMVESGRIAILPDVVNANRFLLGVGGAGVAGNLGGENKDLFRGQAETLKQFNDRIGKWVNGLVEGGIIQPGEERNLIDAIDQYRKAIQSFSGEAGSSMGANQIVPGPGSLVPGPAPQSQKVDYWDPAWGPVPLDRRFRVHDQIGPQSSLPGTFTGIGGPDLVFPLDSNIPRPIPLEVRPEATQQIEQLDGSLRRLGQTAIEGSQNIGISAESFELIKKYSTDSLDGITDSVQKNVPKLNTATASWTKGLGQAVTGLSLAASSVIGIVGGIQNIQKGGAGNVLSGIGSVLTTVGSIGMSVAGFMKPSGFGGPAAAGNNPWTSAVQSIIPNANGNAFENGELMKFANGGIVQSPTLFSFEDAGVTRAGQAGEAGTEAIMPLKRTKDGRLGVEADLSIPFEGGSLMVDEEPPTTSSGGSSIPFRSRSGGTQQQALSIPFMRADAVSAEFGGDAVDGPIKFESTVINSVEYVTRAEAEQIGRASAARGAELAQRRIKNNPQVRRSIGMSQ